MRSFFAWCGSHRISGVEIGHTWLLIISALSLWSLTAQAARSPFFKRMTDIAPFSVWGWVLLLTACLMAVACWRRWWGVQRWSLAAAAAWWFFIAGMFYLAGATILSVSVYAGIGISAWWRIAELAMREVESGDG